MLWPCDAKHGLGFRGDVAVVDVPALQWGIGVLSFLFLEILLETLEPCEDLSISLTNRNVVTLASVGGHEVKEQRPVVPNLVRIAQDDPPGCLGREVCRKIWILDAHTPDDLIGL